MIGNLEALPLEPPYEHVKLLCSSGIEYAKRVVAVSKERETCEMIEAIPKGDTFWDIGANTGSYSLIAASRGLRVVAFEPHLPTFQRLCANIALNGMDDRIEAHQIVLAEYSGRVGFRASSDEPGSALHQVVAGDDLFAFTGDSLAVRAGQPDWAKIDVDGTEVAVLTGMERTLPRMKGVQVEVDDLLLGHERIWHLCLRAGLREAKATRHGETSISNVLFLRD